MFVDDRWVDYLRITQLKVQEYMSGIALLFFHSRKKNSAVDFYQMGKCFDAFSSKAIKTVNYASGIPFYDSMELLKLIVNKIQIKIQRLSWSKMNSKLEHLWNLTLQLIGQFAKLPHTIFWTILRSHQALYHASHVNCRLN